MWWVSDVGKCQHVITINLQTLFHFMWPLQDSNLEARCGEDEGEMCRLHVSGSAWHVEQGFAQGVDVPSGFSIGDGGEKEEKLQFEARASRRSTGRSWTKRKYRLPQTPVWSATPTWRATPEVASDSAESYHHHVFPKGISTLEYLWFPDFILIPMAGACKRIKQIEFKFSTGLHWVFLAKRGFA